MFPRCSNTLNNTDFTIDAAGRRASDAPQTPAASGLHGKTPENRLPAQIERAVHAAEDKGERPRGARFAAATGSPITF
jgi:hypothetical protein